MMLEWISLLDWSWWAVVLSMLLVGFVWAPKTWTPGELVSAASMNTNIRDHLNESLRTQATTLTSVQNNFALEGPFAYLECNNAACLHLTGFLVDGGNVDGARVIIEVLSENVTLYNQSANSATSNRIITPDAANLVLTVGGRALMVYDGTALRWRAARASGEPIGRPGGRTVIGGTASGEDLKLQSTSHATKGKVLLGAAGASAYDEVNDRLGIGTNAPEQKIHAKSTTSSYFLGLQLESTFTNAQVLIYFVNDAQTWALMVSSGDNFGIRDVTGGNLDPFVIEASCPSGTLRLASDGRVGMGAAPAVSAKLNIASTVGAFLLPRMTTAQRNALTGANGMMIYNTTNERTEYIENGAWVYHASTPA